MANAELFRNELKADEMLEVIFTYAAKIANEKKLETLLVLMADMGRDLVVADRCTLWLLDEDRQVLWTKVAHGIDRVEIPASTGLAGNAVQTGEPIIISNAYEDLRFNRDVDRKTGYLTKSVIVIPIHNQENQIIGCYQAVNKMTSADAVFSDHDLKHLTLAASYTGKSLEAAILYEEIEQTQREIIFTMGEIGETRSKETGNHVKRVARYSGILARGVGMSEEEVDLVVMASPMHDIGKVAIPDSILNKPGKLTEEEYEIMQSHTRVGYNLLKGSNRRILKAAAIIAYEHHEKWNGTGYPEGKSGEDIHIYGRITALADVFDALASDRVYKNAWELERILSLFREESGKHFDPKLVDIFFENLDEIVRVKELYKDVF
ncbi:HD domain-containing protein [Peribacillus saganii]|uniref:HD domain-containing protein n=1 Tax=Peribacillus saganii TaxID=2303992 RepID=A0A372LQD9_9BACI|nr:HD domain-containing phosphohydrolase [Peribacillus saganii]RFU69538.1 HD domain-containing protein [Peribacillus saganii]